MEVVLLFVKENASPEGGTSYFWIARIKSGKPSDTRWLSHERCMRAIRKELPALILALQQLYDSTGDAEAFGLSILPSSFSRVVSVFFLSDVLEILARINVILQRKVADFSKLQIMLQFTCDELKSLKREKADWCSLAESMLAKLETEYEITIGRSFFAKISSIKEYLSHIGIPYIDALLENTNSRFSDSVVKLLVATSIFNPAQLPAEESLSYCGLQEIQELTDFYGNEASVEYFNETHTSLPLLDREELISEWKIFRRALYNEKEKLLRFKNSTPSTQQVLALMQSSNSYKCIFPQSFKILNIILFYQLVQQQ